MDQRNNFTLHSRIREWIEENKTLANILAASLLFVAEIVVAKVFHDFDGLYPNDDPPEQRMLKSVLLIIGLATLATVNVYGVPAFLKWLDSGERRPVTRLLIFGTLFGSFFCAPVIGVLVGLSFALFLALTIDGVQSGDLFPRRGDEDIVILRRVAEIRQSPGFRDCLQKGVVGIRCGILKIIFHFGGN